MNEPTSAGISKASRFKGCLLGCAIGDALGASVEFLSWRDIRATHGPDGLKGFVPAYGRLGAITDDTQMSLFTAEGLLRAFVRGNTKGICHVPGIVYHAYVQWLNTQGENSKSHFNGSDVGRLHAISELNCRRAPGSSCLSALKKSRMGTIEHPINDSKGCGGIMRVAPVGLIYDDDPEKAFEIGCEVAALTHGHPTGYLSAGMLAALISFLVGGHNLITAISSATEFLNTKRHNEECLHAIAAALDNFASPAMPVVDTIETMGAGWTAEEALGISLYCALRGKDNFSAGVLMAVNHSGDSDSTGSITGNILGALLGKSAIPQNWIKELELAELTESLADDLSVKFCNSEEWWEKYPGW